MVEVEADAFGRVYGETPIDPSKLKKAYKWVKKRSQLNAVEATGLEAAYRKYLSAIPTSRAAPFALQWALRLNGEMFGKVWTWAGKPRRVELEGIGSKWFNVEAELQSLLEDLKTWKSSGMPIIEQAAMLHHRAVLIHPFENGNGRWARLMANIWLKQNGQGIIAWPDEDLVGKESSIREEYIAALKAADAGNLDPLVEMHKKYQVAVSAP
jgi:fido (protein-threonine AMPylation protein)